MKRADFKKAMAAASSSIRDLVKDNPESPMAVLNRKSTEAAASETGAFFFAVDVMEARFVPHSELTTCTFVVLVKRVDIKDPKVHKFVTESINQTFRADIDQHFRMPVDVDCLGALEVTLEWWHPSQKQLVDSRSFMVQKSVDDRWHAFKGMVDGATMSAAVRVSILLSSRMGTDSSAEMLQRMFSDADIHDKFGVVVPGGFRWEFAVYTSLHLWLEARQRVDIEEYLSVPISQRKAQRLRELLWLGLPSEYRLQIYMYLISKEIGEAGEHASVILALSDEDMTADYAILADDVDDASIENLLSSTSNVFGSGNRVKVESRALARMLSVFQLQHPEVGHLPCVQMVAAHLLMALPEDPAFRVLEHLNAHYFTRVLRPTLSELCLDACVIREILSSQLPNLMNHFRLIKYDISLLILHWLAVLGLGIFPSDLSLRIFDLVLYEGPVAVGTILIALLRHLESLLICIKSPSSVHDFILERSRHFYDSSFLIHLARREFNAWIRIMPAIHRKLTERFDEMLFSFGKKVRCTRQLLDEWDGDAVKSFAGHLAQTERLVDMAKFRALLNLTGNIRDEEIFCLYFAAFDESGEAVLDPAVPSTWLILLSNRSTDEKLRRCFDLFNKTETAVISHEAFSTIALAIYGLAGYITADSSTLEPLAGYLARDGCDFADFTDALRNLPLMTECLNALDSVCRTGLVAAREIIEAEREDVIVDQVLDDGDHLVETLVPQTTQPSTSTETVQEDIPEPSDSAAFISELEVMVERIELVRTHAPVSAEEEEVEVSTPVAEPEPAEVVPNAPVQPESAVPAGLSLEEEEAILAARQRRFTGWYACTMYEEIQDKHMVCIKPGPDGNLIWLNKAGESWSLVLGPEDADFLVVGEDCPYPLDSPVFRWEWAGSGEPLCVYGPNDEPYVFKGRLE